MLLLSSVVNIIITIIIIKIVCTFKTFMMFNFLQKYCEKHVNSLFLFTTVFYSFLHKCFIAAEIKKKFHKYRTLNNYHCNHSLAHEETKWHHIFILFYVLRYLQSSITNSGAWQRVEVFFKTNINIFYGSSRRHLL